MSSLNPNDQLLTTMETVLKKFFLTAEKHYKLPENALSRLWKGESVETTTVPVKTTEVAPSKPKQKEEGKKSSYQIFFSQQRTVIMRQNPKASFGDVSKQVSAMWKTMSIEQKNRFVDTPATKVEEKSTLPDKAKSGSKKKAPPASTPTLSLPIVATTNKATTRPPAIVSTKKTTAVERKSVVPIGRTKVEIPVMEEEKEEPDDEEDFFFQEDDVATNDGDCDGDEFDDDLDDNDDSTIFEDDDD